MNIQKLLRGFTLIELLVTSAILAVLAAVTVPYFHGFAARQELNQAVEQVRTDLRAVQNRAVSATDRGSDPNYYWWWGIDFDQNSENYDLILRRSDDGGNPESGAVNQSSRTKRLPGGLRTEDIADADVNVWFKMITGDVYIGPSPLPGFRVINVCRDAATCRSVTVFAGGRIE